MSRYVSAHEAVMAMEFAVIGCFAGPTGEMGELTSLGLEGGTLEESGVTLFRGLANDHPFFEDALEGTARPFGGHSDPLLHNQGNTFSEFTSWTTNRSVAVEAAENRAGVVLQRTFRPSQLIKSRDLYGESEVLIRGIVRGARVTEP